MVRLVFKLLYNRENVRECRNNAYSSTENFHLEKQIVQFIKVSLSRQPRQVKHRVLSVCGSTLAFENRKQTIFAGTLPANLRKIYIYIYIFQFWERLAPRSFSSSFFSLHRTRRDGQSAVDFPGTVLGKMSPLSRVVAVALQEESSALSGILDREINHASAPDTDVS